MARGRRNCLPSNHTTFLICFDRVIFILLETLDVENSTANEKVSQGTKISGISLLKILVIVVMV